MQNSGEKYFPPIAISKQTAINRIDYHRFQGNYVETQNMLWQIFTS